jgi:hypothetical protein
VSLAKLQLVGITCLFVSSDVEEIVAPFICHFLHCADSSYTEPEILLAERCVPKTIDWNLSFPNPMHFLRRISKADDYDVKVQIIGKYLLEVTLEWRLLATPPSLMAPASIWLARLILDNYKWVGTSPHSHQMFSDSFHEDCKPHPLFLLHRERVAPFRELDVKLHCNTHTT